MERGVNAVRQGEEDFAKEVTLWHQCRALFLKDLTLQLRAIGTNLCQLLTPIIFICFAGIMQVIINNILTANGTAIPGTNAFPIPVNPGRLEACSKNNSENNPELCHDEIFNFYVEFPHWDHNLSGIESHVPAKMRNATDYFIELFEDVEVGSIMPCYDTLFDLPFYYVGVSDGVDLDLGNLTADDTLSLVNRTGFLGGMVPDVWYYNFSLDFNATTWPPMRPINDTYNDTHNDICNVDGGEYLHVPFFWRVSNRTELNDHLIEVVKEYNVLAHTSLFGSQQYDRTYSVSPLSKEQYKTVMEYIQNRTFDKVRPQGGILVDQFNASGDSVTLNYTMVADDLVLYTFKDPSKAHKLNRTTNEIHRKNGIINMMSNSLFKYLRENETSGDLAGADPAIVTYIMPLPAAPMNITIDLSTLLGGVLFPFAFSFIMPVFITMLVKDRHEKHLIMMEQNGLSRWTYWLVKYCFNYLLYTIIVVVVSAFTIAFQIRLFTQTNALVLILTLFLWGHAQVVLGFFFNNFFSRPKTGTIVGYLLVIAGVVVALLLEALQVVPKDDTPFPVYMMYPPFAFYRILFYLINACLSMQCYGIDILSPADGLNLVTTAMLYLAGSTVVLIFISIYISYVLPGEYGVRRSPFFPLIGLFKAVRYPFVRSGCCNKLHRQKRELSPKPPDMVGDQEEEEEEVDEDVRAEEDILREGFPHHAPMVMHQLRKEYPGSGGKPPHIAVHSISLVIQRNECFGLLGPNGAGKTTLISVLTGLYEPTRGRARIAGYDIETEIQEIHRHLGVCPQFDIQDADLTAEEHLFFYARLKGVKWSREKAVVERALRQVNLYDARGCRSKALSGGMRRRLSVAMAVIGNPDILILDEPTTGLDPASRRQVWEVIETVKEGRSVILTTHAMEEADHLCTRIGIMNFGRLRCLGTQTRLKTRFGTGYQLQFHCVPGKARQVESFIKAQLPRATHMETYADSCTYKLDKEDLVVSELFQLFDSKRRQVGILDWGIKMTTLEDVFLNIVKRNTDRRTPLKHSFCPSWLPCPCPTTSRKTLIEE